jgi:VanZ like protein/concanavalin A-like lectin/glucanase superfamily protein
MRRVRAYDCLELDHVSRRIVTLLTVGIWVGIFVAGLWPFNFVPRNRTHWLPGGAGLRFDGYGQVYSSVPMFSPRGADGVAESTIELILNPSKSYDDASTVFAFVKQNEVSFAIGQSLTDLFLQGSFTQSGGKPVAKLWIDDVCGHAQELFVTVVLDTRHVDVYLDGQLARSFPVSTRADNLSGKVLVGHSVKGSEQWRGSVARLAIFEGTLDAAEIGQRYGQWTKTRHLDREVNHRCAAYDFATPARDFVRNVGETGPDLIVPKTFRLSKPTVLEWPDHLDRSVVVDAVVNIAGFVPFGLVTCLCLRFWTGWGISRCVFMTILVGASVSLVIELLQVFLPTRDSSLADLVTNILGTVLGAGAAVFVK